MHLKRHKASKKLPIERKKLKYLARADRNSKEGVPVLIALRDMLHIAKRKKEVERAINEKNILLNGKALNSIKAPILIYDNLSIKGLNKHYRLNISKTGRFILEEISEKDAEQKIAKVINKTKIGNGKIQVNFLGGINLITNEKLKVSDSVIIKNGKITKVLPLKENSRVLIVGGRSIGCEGVIEKIGDLVEIKTEERTAKISPKNILVIG